MIKCGIKCSKFLDLLVSSMSNMRRAKTAEKKGALQRKSKNPKNQHVARHMNRNKLSQSFKTK